VQFGADLAFEPDDGNKLRVLPIVGRGSVQSVAGVLFLQGVGIGIWRFRGPDAVQRRFGGAPQASRRKKAKTTPCKAEWAGPGSHSRRVRPGTGWSVVTAQPDRILLWRKTART
jgi:hypothetical protein